MSWVMTMQISGMRCSPQRRIALSAVLTTLLAMQTFLLGETRADDPVASAKAQDRVLEAFPETRLLNEKLAAVMVIRWDRVCKSPVFPLLREFGPLEALKEPLRAYGVKLDDVERITVSLSQEIVDAAALATGFTDAPPRGELIPFPMTVILTSTRPLDRDRTAALPLVEEVKGERICGNPDIAAWLPTERSIVFGPLDEVRHMIVRSKATGTPSSSILNRLRPESDGTLAIDVLAQSGTLDAISRIQPSAAMLLYLRTLAVHVNVSKGADETLVEAIATAAGDASAQILFEQLSPGLDQIRESLKTAPRAVPSGMERGAAIGIRAIEKASLKQDRETISFRVTVPDGFETLSKTLLPALKAKEEMAARQSRLKLIGFAFHAFHELHGEFPGAGQGADGKQGLSWRVHLLPYLGQRELYEQFQLDEPWDSEHNRTLIEKMPDAYKTRMTEKPGSSAIHVFTGKGAPFADNRRPEIGDFHDGTWSTILAVEAAPEKADIWTKPGGLDFDPKAPLKALGKLDEPTWIALMADGAFRHTAAMVDQDVLRRMILWQDGELLELP